MIIVKSPFRVSLFGGSTDYPSYYEKNGAFLIGTTINKYVYLSTRIRPNILPKENVIVYSKLECEKDINDIKNPLIRETLRDSNIEEFIELISFSDIPSRTGLGGSSSFCVGMIYLLNKLQNKAINKKSIAKQAINIERNILKEHGGIQDQILASYGGLNSIEIKHNGDFCVKPLPVTIEFKEELENSIILIYTNDQREHSECAKSQDGVNKSTIQEISKQAYSYFLKEDIKSIGGLLYQTWKEKAKLSNIISNNKIDNIIKDVMYMGAYGAKLLGSGGCGFILVICDSRVKNKIISNFSDYVLEVKLEDKGVSQ